MTALPPILTCFLHQLVHKKERPVRLYPLRAFLYARNHPQATLYGAILPDHFVGQNPCVDTHSLVIDTVDVVSSSIMLQPIELLQPHCKILLVP